MEKYQEQHEDDQDQVYEAEEPEPRYVSMPTRTINKSYQSLKNTHIYIYEICIYTP